MFFVGSVIFLFVMVTSGSGLIVVSPIMTSCVSPYTYLRPLPPWLYIGWPFGGYLVLSSITSSIMTRKTRGSKPYYKGLNHKWRISFLYTSNFGTELSDKVQECLSLPLTKSEQYCRQFARAYILEEVELELFYELGKGVDRESLQSNVSFSCWAS